jgi:uncharacterized membrane protein
MEENFMNVRRILLCLFLSVLTGLSTATAYAASDPNGVTLYTPYTKISVSPGQSIDYSIDVINNSKEQQTAELALSGVPRSWKYQIQSGGWNISQLSILPGEKKSFSLKIEVPYQVNKGNYRFKLTAGANIEPLALTVNIAEQGTYETSFTTDQPNMQGHSGQNFTFRTTLKNQTANQQLYALMADATRGWTVTFKSAGQSVTSVEMEANSSKDITVEITPPAEIGAGTYKIPVSAETSSTSAKLELEVVITGSYSMELTTPTGLLSAEITAGAQKKIQLSVRNTGTSVLSDISLSSSTPSKWQVEFDPKKIDKLLPGKDAQVTATIKADKNAIPGDYVLNLESRTPEVTAKATFRISVQTSMLWGWVGVLIIAAALGSVFWLFRKYGRR